MSRREAFIEEALRLSVPLTRADGVIDRAWYVWGGRGPGVFDCSGLVLHCLWHSGGPDWRATYWSGRLWRELPPTARPQPGDLAFYGPPGSVNHVMAVLGASTNGVDYPLVGASGGDRGCVSVEVARQRRAFVKRKPTHLYRPGFKGFRSLYHLDKPRSLSC